MSPLRQGKDHPPFPPVGPVGPLGALLPLMGGQNPMVITMTWPRPILSRLSYLLGPKHFLMASTAFPASRLNDLAPLPPCYVLKPTKVEMCPDLLLPPLSWSIVRGKCVISVPANRWTLVLPFMKLAIMKPPLTPPTTNRPQKPPN